MKYFIASLLFFLLSAVKSPAREVQTPLARITADTLTFMHWDHDAQNFTIRVTRKQVYFMIDTWDKVLLKRTWSLSKKKYDSFVKSLDSLHIKSLPNVEVPGCIGGSSRRFILYPGTSREVKGFKNACSGPINGNLQGDVQKAAELFMALVPDIEKKLASTLKDD